MVDVFKVESGDNDQDAKFEKIPLEELQTVLIEATKGRDLKKVRKQFKMVRNELNSICIFETLTDMVFQDDDSDKDSDNDSVGLESASGEVADAEDILPSIKDT